MIFQIVDITKATKLYSLALRFKGLTMYKINTFKNSSSQFSNGATVCTPDRFALEARCKRLKETLKHNTKKGA
jgi:hypothetical protein